MRTTLDIDTVVLEQLKKRQLAEGKTLGRLVSELLARELAREEAGPIDVSWPSKRLGQRIDIEDKHALHAILDGNR